MGGEVQIKYLNNNNNNDDEDDDEINWLKSDSERKTILFGRVQKCTFAVHKSLTQIVFYSKQLQESWFKVTVNNFTSNRLPNFITTIRLCSVIKNILTQKCNIAFFTYT